MTDPSATLTGRLCDRIGIPRSLMWAYLGVFLFMVGDGVESNYLAPYLSENGLTRNDAAVVITIYGVTVALGSWLSGTLSTLLGPRRVMVIGAGIWVVFEVIFLAVALPSQNYWLVLISYGIRGIGYPLFAYSFLVWINAVTSAEKRGASVGWFWFAFTGGLPTLGSLFASGTIPVVGEYTTLWLSLGLVIVGALFAVVATTEQTGRKPLAAGITAGRALMAGITIAWRRPRVGIGGVVRIINTTPQYGFFVILPFLFTETVGFSQSEYLTLVAVIYATNIFANLFFGYVGDFFGWRRTILLFGCVGCTATTLLLYYGSIAVGDNFLMVSFFGALFGFTLAGFVPLSALLPSMTSFEDRGNALAVLNLGAGMSTFVGPGIVAAVGPLAGAEGVVWVFAGLYVCAAIMTLLLRDSSDPSEQRKAQRLAASEAVAAR